MNQIRYFSLLGLFILLCYAAPASLWVDSLKGQTLFEKLSGLSKRNRLPHVDLNTRIIPPYPASLPKNRLFG